MSAHTPPVSNPAQCPLCGQANQCAVAAGLPAEQCWCMHTPIAREALARVPVAERRQRCICLACGQATPPEAG